MLLQHFPLVALPLPCCIYFAHLWPRDFLGVGAGKEEVWWITSNAVILISFQCPACIYRFISFLCFLKFDDFKVEVGQVLTQLSFENENRDAAVPLGICSRPESSPSLQHWRISWRNFPDNCRKAPVSCYGGGEGHPRFVIGLQERGLPLCCSDTWYGFSTADFSSIHVSLCLAQCPVSGSTGLEQSGKNPAPNSSWVAQERFLPPPCRLSHAVKQRISAVCVCFANRKVICAVHSLDSEWNMLLKNVLSDENKAPPYLLWCCFSFPNI